MELISISTVPGFAPSIMPPSPSATSFTCGEFGSMVMITSHCSAIAFADAAVSAPAAITSAIASGLRSAPPTSNLLEEVFTHWFTHDTEANKTNFHCHVFISVSGYIFSSASFCVAVTGFAEIAPRSFAIQIAKTPSLATPRFAADGAATWV
jgi:hypothetical protein